MNDILQGRVRAAGLPFSDLKMSRSLPIASDDAVNSIVTDK